MEFWDRLTNKEKVEYVSFGGGGFGVFIAILIYIVGPKPIGGGLFLASLVLAFTPYGLYSYFESKKYKDMERQFPAFLRNLSEALKSGMSLPQSFQNASDTDYGRLNEEIDLSAKQLSWDIPFPEVMNRLKKRVNESRLISNSISIIMQSYESGGDIAKTLDSIARNISDIKEAEKERNATLMQQVYIIYAIYFLFVGIVIALYRILQPLLNIGGGGFIGGSPNFCTTVAAVKPLCNLCPVLGLHASATAKLCYYKALFILMLMVQGVFSGLVAGEIGSGDVSSGVKHALIMVPTGVVAYIVILSVM